MTKRRDSGFQPQLTRRGLLTVGSGVALAGATLGPRQVLADTATAKASLPQVPRRILGKTEDHDFISCAHFQVLGLQIEVIAQKMWRVR